MEKMFSLKNAIPFENNPRGLSKKGASDLTHSLHEFGDLSGIVINIRTGEIVSGNQRSTILDIQKATVKWEKVYNTPTLAGTVAIGHTYINDEPFRVRLVDWDATTAQIANIAANKIGGFFDFDLLQNFDEEILIAGGFELGELAGWIEDEDDDMFDKDEEDKEEENEEGAEEIFRIILNFQNLEDMKEAKIYLSDYFREINMPVKIDEVS
jgi:hypothetical protein